MGNIALFGTSADPPTIGHKKILEELSKIYDFTISYVSDNPQKKHILNLLRQNLKKLLMPMYSTALKKLKQM